MLPDFCKACAPTGPPPPNMALQLTSAAAFHRARRLRGLRPPVGSVGLAAGPVVYLPGQPALAAERLVR